MNAPLETSPAAAPPAPESRFVRIVRLAMIFSICSFFLCIILLFILDKFSVRWLQTWMLVLILGSMGVGLISGVLRLGHALWVSAQYAMSELLLTFFSASLVSMALIEWMKRDSGRGADITGSVIAIVLVTFAIFLSGSAWVWDVFRRAPRLELNRYVGMLCGWLASIGLLCFAGFLLVSIICSLAGGWDDNEVLKWFLIFLFGSFLAIPGILIERAARLASPPPSAPTPSPPSAP